MPTKHHETTAEAMSLMARLALNEERQAEALVSQAQIIQDLTTELARFKRANRRSLDMLTDALHAHDAGRSEVVNEFLQRVIDDLYFTANPVKDPDLNGGTREMDPELNDHLGNYQREG